MQSQAADRGSLWSALGRRLQVASAALRRAASRAMLPLVIALGLLAPACSPAVAATALSGLENTVPTGNPEWARVGMVVTQLYDFNVRDSTFGVEFWLWSLELADGHNLLLSSSFANAASVVRSPIEVRKKSTDEGEKKLFIQSVRGTFRHDWSLADFPFDQQNLRIILQEDRQESSELLLVPDVVNTDVDAEILDGWRVDNWSLRPGQRLYQSRFGDEVKGAEPLSRYSRLLMTIQVSRISAAALWRLCAAPLAAVMLVLLSYFIDVSLPGALPARAGLVGASLFAEIISLRAFAGEVGNETGLTLIEALHLRAIVYTLLAATITSIQCFQLSRSVGVRAMRRLDRFAALVSSLVLIVLVLTSFLRAINRI